MLCRGRQEVSVVTGPVRLLERAGKMLLITWVMATWLVHGLHFEQQGFILVSPVFLLRGSYMNMNQARSMIISQHRSRGNT